MAQARSAPREDVQPVVLKPGEGHVHPGFPELVLKAPADATHGVYSLHEEVMPPGYDGPPVHFHRDQEEAFFVTQGTLTLVLVEDVLEAPAGTFILVPAGWRHGFANRTQEVVRSIGIFSPRGFDHGFEEIGAWIGRAGDAAEGRRLSEKYGVVVTGPPLGSA